MSDDSTQGSGWWQAADGKWYPPELHPDHGAAPPAPAPPSTPEPAPVPPVPPPPPPAPAPPTPDPAPARGRVRTSVANRVLLVVGLGVTIALILLAVTQTTGGTDEELTPSAFTVPTEGHTSDTGTDDNSATTLPPEETTTTAFTTTTGSIDGTTTSATTGGSVLDSVPSDIAPTCTTNPESIGGAVVDAVDCEPGGDDAPNFATYLLFTDQAAADGFYDTLLSNHAVPVGECGDSPPRDCTYTGGSGVDARYADFDLDGSACRLWTDDEEPITSYACRDDGDYDGLDRWWANAGPA